MASVALCLICHDRPDEVRTALDSARGDQWDDVLVVDMASDPPLEPVPGARLLRSDENLGVCAGRNLIAREVGSDVLVFLDDDAVLHGAVRRRLEELFDADPKLGVVAFRIVRSDGSIQSAEYPFRGSPRDADTSRPCAYFLGGAHAVRREAFVESGGYDETFFYSTEEIDLAYRLIASGYRLWYDADIVVEHRPSRRGRRLQPQVPAMRLRNRIIFARRHLPILLAVVHVLAWAARTLLEAIRSRAVTPWLRAWREGLAAPVLRRPLGVRQLASVHRLGGRVLW